MRAIASLSKIAFLSLDRYLFRNYFNESNLQSEAILKILKKDLIKSYM